MKLLELTIVPSFDYHDTITIGETPIMIPYLSGYNNFAIIPILPFPNNPKDLDPSYKMDLDLCDCFGRKKTLSYNQRNTVLLHSRVSLHNAS